MTSQRVRQRHADAILARLEAKRQAILDALDEQTRAELADETYAVLAALKHSGRLNMLPDMDCLG